MAIIKKPVAKKAQNGVTQVTTKHGSMGYDPNTKISSRQKTKYTEKLNSKEEPYVSKYKSIGYDLDKNNKPTNPTISKYKTDSFGKEIKRTTNPVSMGRAKRNVRKKLGSDAPEAMKKGGVVKAKNGKSFPDLNKDGKITKADILKGRGVIAKKGAAVKKCKYGCN